MNHHPLRQLLRACLPLAVLAAPLGLVGAGGTASASVSPGSGGAGIGGGAPATTPSTTATPGASTVPDTATTPGAAATPDTIVPGTTVTSGAASVLAVGGSLTASGGGITLDSPRIALLNGRIRFTGSVTQAKPGETVVIQRQGVLPGYWVSAASATVDANGKFDASWHVNQSGSLQVRAELESPAEPPIASAAAVASRRAAARSLTLATTSALTLTVYRAAIATFFGPGLFGRRTACGERLGRATLGVANRTLPCGSMVAIYYRGRELVVPVIDRGPYAHHASWDLTMATATALGIRQTVRIGALSPPPAA